MSIIIPFLLALLFDCPTALTHQHDRLRDAEVTISAWNGCAVTGTINGVNTTLFMGAENCPLRAKVPGKFRIRYDESCGAIVEITDGPVITTPMPVACPSPDPSPTPKPTPAELVVSPEGAKGERIVDAARNEWTLGALKQTLRNGAHVADGFGLVYKWLNGKVFVQGTDLKWYEFTGVRWIAVGSEPGVTPSPSPVATPTPTPAPTATPSPLPSPSPVKKPCKAWPPWKLLNCV